jgi:C4-dicarboxylate-binding protein DctP
MGEALAFGNQIADTQNDKALAALRTFPGTRIHVPAARPRSRGCARPCSVHAGLSQRIGAAWLDEARARAGPWCG